MYNYNEFLIEDRNNVVLAIVKNIGREELIKLTSRVVSDIFSGNVIENGLLLPMSRFGRSLVVTEDSLKGFFAVTMNGTNVVWEAIQRKYGAVIGVDVPLYENVLEYIDEMIDSLDLSHYVAALDLAA